MSLTLLVAALCVGALLLLLWLDSPTPRERERLEAYAQRQHELRQAGSRNRHPAGRDVA